MLELSTRDRPWDGSVLLVEFTSVRNIPVHLRQRSLSRPMPHAVTCLLGNKVEDVGANIPSTEGVQAPIGLDGSNLGIMVIKVAVSCANKLFGYSITKENADNAVLLGVGVVFVEGEHDEGVLHEFLVVQEGLEKGFGPGTGNGHGAVVAIRGHVRSDEHPLRKSIVTELFVEKSQVLNLAQAAGLLCDRVVENWRVVLANVVVGTGLLVAVIEALEAGVRHVLLVGAPRDALGLQQIHNGRDVGRDGDHVVMVDTVVVSRDCGSIVGHGGMGDGKVVGQGDALLGQPCEAGVANGKVVVGVLQPDDGDAVEGLALDPFGGLVCVAGGGGCAGGEQRQGQEQCRDHDGCCYEVATGELRCSRSQGCGHRTGSDDVDA